jgi:hypothetical protein
VTSDKEELRIDAAMQFTTGNKLPVEAVMEFAGKFLAGESLTDNDEPANETSTDATEKASEVA